MRVGEKEAELKWCLAPPDGTFLKPFRQAAYSSGLWMTLFNRLRVGCRLPQKRPFGTVGSPAHTLAALTAPTLWHNPASWSIGFGGRVYEGTRALWGEI